jgi:hypothetical protein
MTPPKDYNENYKEQPDRTVSLGTPEEIAAAMQKSREEHEYDLYHSPHSANLFSAARTLKSFKKQAADETPEQTDEILRNLASGLLSNIHTYRGEKIEGLLNMLLNQASVLDAVFNRSLQQAGMDDEESFCPAKVDLALQAQRQCRILLDFVTKNLR